MTSTIIGTGKLDQLEDNLASVDLELSPDEVERLDQVSALVPEYPQWMPSGERGQVLFEEE